MTTQEVANKLVAYMRQGKFLKHKQNCMRMTSFA
jgi:hypothetical protein